MFVLGGIDLAAESVGGRHAKASGSLECDREEPGASALRLIGGRANVLSVSDQILRCAQNDERTLTPGPLPKGEGVNQGNAAIMPT